MLETEVIVNVYKELDKENIPTNPGNKTHKGTPDSVPALATKIIATVNIVFVVNGVDLLHLPMFMHWHSVVSLGDIRFPHYKGDVTVRLSKGNKCRAKLRDGVEWEVGHLRFVDHCVGGEIPCAEVGDKAEVDCVQFRNNMYRHGIHAW